MIRYLMDLALGRARDRSRTRALCSCSPASMHFMNSILRLIPTRYNHGSNLLLSRLGYSAEEVEKLATIPLEWGLAGMRNLRGNPNHIPVRFVRR